MTPYEKYQEVKNIYLNNGLKVIPLKEKIPVLDNWLENCTNDCSEVANWLGQCPEINFGLPCQPNNLFVLDIDAKEGQHGLESWKNLLNDLGLEEPETLVQKTANGGLHFIFLSDDDLKKLASTVSAFEKYPDIDIRNQSQIVVYPSEVNGKKYEFLNHNPIKQMPLKLKKFLMKNIKTIRQENLERKKFYENINSDNYLPDVVFPKGQRDVNLFSFINDLYYFKKLDYDEIMELAHQFNEKCLEEPFSDKTVEYKVNKAFCKFRPIKIIIGTKGVDK